MGCFLVSKEDPLIEFNAVSLRWESNWRRKIGFLTQKLIIIISIWCDQKKSGKLHNSKIFIKSANMLQWEITVKYNLGIWSNIL